ncbi:gypsy type transposase [Tanacetum coccineum]|uniref:Gypsy type transposase n=1 Tax=Tanacetum coccineum TaxID=301880 RepID=A0ABQ5C8K7_9ASTR
MGRDTIQLEGVVSTISGEYLLEFTSEYGIPKNLHPEVPGLGETIVDFLEGKVGVYTRFFEFANYRIPLSQFLFDILGHYQIHLSQLLVIGAAKGWMSFSKRPGKNTPQCYTKPLDSLKNWNNRFFWIDERIFPTAVDLRASVPRDEMPIAGSYSATDWPIHQLDVKNAFLNGDLSETVYMHQPPGFVDSRYATRANFSPSRCDSLLFTYTQGSQVAYLLIYVDDIILIASSSQFYFKADCRTLCIKSLIDPISGLFKLFSWASCCSSSYKVIFVSKKYARQLLERAHMVNCNPSRTPIDTDSKLGPDGVPVQDPTLYRSLAGGAPVSYLYSPRFSMQVQHVCLYMHDPREPHFAALKRILRYVQGTLELGLQLYASATTSLVGYTDADWAGCPSTRRFTSGYCVFLGDNLLSWSAKRQHTISCSSAEADYGSTLVYCDNVSAVYMSANPVQHQRIKNIEIDIHFVRDMVKVVHVWVLHVPSRFQYADIFTKGLPSALFEDFRSILSPESVTPNPIQCHVIYMEDSNCGLGSGTLPLSRESRLLDFDNEDHALINLAEGQPGRDRRKQLSREGECLAVHGESEFREINLPLRRRVAQRYLSAGVRRDQQLSPRLPGGVPRHGGSHSAAWVAMGSQLRLKFEQEVKLLKKATAKIARRDQKIQAREKEIKKLDEEIRSLRTVETKVHGLRNRTQNLETLLEVEVDMKNAAEAKSVDLAGKLVSLRAQFSDLQVNNHQLSQQVSTLQAQVTGKERIKAAFEEFKKSEDEKVKQRCAEMDARLDALRIDFDEVLYPHMLTAIAGRPCVIRHGLPLAIMKCAESTELRQAFADVVSPGIVKGMSEGLKYGVENGGAKLDLAAIEAYDPEAEAKYVAALIALKDLKYPLVDQLEKLRDTPIDLLMASLHLENPWSIQEEVLLEDDITANRSRAKKKKKYRVVCRTHGVGSVHHARSDGILVSAPTVAPQGLAILLADAAVQTEASEDEASPRLLRSKSLPPMYNLYWP